MHRYSRPIRMAVAVTLLGCSNSTSEPDLSSEIRSDFPISVSSGTSPVISWSGSRGSGLSVDDLSSNTITEDVFWDLTGSNSNSGGGFLSPVTYGVLPAGAECGYTSTSATCPKGKPLIKGHRYMLVIVTTEFKVGAKIFIP